MSIEVEGRKFRDPPVLDQNRFEFGVSISQVCGARAWARIPAARRPLASKKWKRPLVSHAGGGGDFVHFGPLYE